MANPTLSPRSPRHRTSHRRKLSRRSVVVARSRTMPVLHIPNAATGSLAMATPFAPTPHVVSSTPTSLEGRRKKHGLFDALKSKERERPGSSPGYASSRYLAGEASPLPTPLTPKAAQILGLTVENGTHTAPIGGVVQDHRDDAYCGPDLDDSDNKSVGQLQTDGTGGEDKSRSGSWVQLPALRKRASESLLTALKSSPRVHPKFKADVENSDTEVPATGSKKKYNTKAMRMLDLLPSFTPRGKNGPSPLSSPLIEQGAGGNSSDSNISPRPLPTLPIHSTARRPKRKSRKRQAKDLETMTPITENSQSEGSLNVSDSEDAQLNALYDIYGDNSGPYVNTSLPRSTTLPYLQGPRYDPDQNELSNVSNGMEKRQRPEVLLDDQPAPIWGSVPNYSNCGRLGWDTARGAFQSKSPLQQVEQKLLDRTEENMERRLNIHRAQELNGDEKRKLKQHKRRSLNLAKEKSRLDAEVLKLRENQQKFKMDFKTLKTDCSIEDSLIWITPPTEVKDEDEDERDAESLCSIRSSVDSSDVSYICEAQFQSITKVAPRTAQIIDIPTPNQKRTVATAENAAFNYPNSIDNSKEIDPLNVSKEQKNVDAPMSAPPPSGFSHSKEGLEPFPPYVDYHEHFTRPRKMMLPREESRSLVQNWITQCSNTEQPPVSVRVDTDVLVDCQVAPAPLPKDGFTPISRTLSPPKMDRLKVTPNIPERNPARKALSASIKSPPQPPKLHCVQVGHTFRPFDLQTIPDNAAIGALGTPPYLRTHAGIKQHVHVPVMCDACAKDVREVLWVCEIPVCGVALCFECALARRESDDGRNTDIVGRHPI